MNDKPEVAASSSAVTIAHADGLHPGASLADLHQHIAEGQYVWLDICSSTSQLDGALLEEFGMDAAEIAWLQRFGQVGRIAITRKGIRAVTWLAAPPAFIELHFWSSAKGVVTFWQGNPEALDDVRQEFVERFAAASRSHYHGAAILLQLLAGRLDEGISFIDERIHALHDQIQKQPESMAPAELSRGMGLLRDVWLKFDRYAGAVRSAMVGVEAIPGIDVDGVRELNEYVDHVEDIESRLQQRFQWGSDVMQDYNTSLAQRQGEQINRLAVVSIIFLPISFLTGYFGMNFNWMAERIANGWVYLALGVLLPIASVGVTVVWLKRRGVL